MEDCQYYRDGRCLGTKEMDPCNRDTCDVYPYPTKRANRVGESICKLCGGQLESVYYAHLAGLNVVSNTLGEKYSLKRCTTCGLLYAE